MPASIRLEGRVRTRRNLWWPVLAAFCLASVALAAGTATKESAMSLPHTRQLIAEKKPVRVVLYGDSISEVKPGWNGGAKTPEANWGAVLVNRLQEAYPDSAFSIHHFAIGGQNSYEGLGRLDGLGPFKPDLVLVAFGANDCCHHYLIPEETTLALATLATEIGTRFGADVVLVGTGGDNPVKPFFRHLDETLQAQQAAAAEAKVPFVDMRAAVLKATENGKRWAEFHFNEENCHPTNKGHEVWAAAALGVIRQQLDTESGDAPVVRRITGRSFPSVFQAWNPADNLKGEDPLVTAARHDLVFNGAEFYKLKWNHEYQGLATDFTPESIRQGLELRKSLLKLNPNMVLILEIRYRDAWGSTAPKNIPEERKKHWRGFLPDNHKWWKRDAAGKLVMGWEEGGFIQLDFANPDYRAQVARQCEAAVKSGVVDGIMLDWWGDDEDRLALVTAIRKQIGEDGLILVNSNDRQIPRTAPFVNGLFMECYRSKTAEDWKRIEDTLAWAEKNLREPRINCLESWYQQSRKDLNLMRATTTLALTTSDGYCLFSDPNPLPTPDHLHDWYPFWNRSLGRPVAKGTRGPDGTIRRTFEKGTVVYNPFYNRAVNLTFDTEMTRLSSGRRGRQHDLPPADGDIFLREVGPTQEMTP
jgi:lysophospholipase L1-like esterase